ncbi:ATPase, partial [Parafannyhessea sp. LCP19S3_B1]
ALDAARSVLAARRRALDADLAGASSQLDHALDFLDAAFGADAQETVVFATHLAVDPAFMAFASAHASTKLAEHGRALMFHERGLDLLKQADRLERG